ncbi:hypothetical protein [Aureimonas sp. SK2]|uniref:hypothetical protein n=1 Tax=Aureimonas sp. SK2 TaxID=3015992 RepID=UPI002444B6C9|nr:hypothetical protein [Aureimonas sp. SK2]
MNSSAALYHAALAEAYRRTRGHYPALDGLDLDDLVVLFDTDEALVLAIADLEYEDIEPIMPFTLQ